MARFELRLAYWRERLRRLAARTGGRLLAARAASRPHFDTRG